MTDTSSPEKGQPTLGAAALFGLCPRCGAKTLFGSVTGFAARCRACGLDYTGFNVGDGPAAILTLLIGALITGLALWVQIAFDPPFWVHVILWVPLTVGAVLYGLRMAKAALLYAEYTRGAGEAGGSDLRKHQPEREQAHREDEN